jgi:hypothetical protein
VVSCNSNPITRQYMFASGQAKKYLASYPLPSICLKWLARQIIVETDREHRLGCLEYYVEYMGESSMEDLLLDPSVDQSLLESEL